MFSPTVVSINFIERIISDTSSSLRWYTSFFVLEENKIQTILEFTL